MLLGKWTNSFELKSCVEITRQNKRISDYYCETKKAVKTTNKYFWNVVELQENMQSFVRKLLLQVVTVLVHCF